MIVAINYADRKYKEAQKYNSMTAISKGKADRVISYSFKNLDKEFVRKNENILRRRRGAGYWLWKPYIIQKTLCSLRKGDYLVYLDSGAFYINNIRYLIKQMKEDKQCIMAFEVPLKERCWTKRDVFICMDCDEQRYAETNQRMGGIIVIKKTERAEQFVDEWLKYGQEGELITDARNTGVGGGNYAGFIENRHDQSIFSLLTKKYGIRGYEDPSQFGRLPELFWRGHDIEKERGCKLSCPQIIALHREGEVTRRIFMEQMFFAYAPKALVYFYMSSGLPDK